MTNILNVEKLNANYGLVQVLWDISLSVGENEIVSLVGPNGAGKSTLLKSVLGLIPQTSGKCFFDSKEIHQLPTNKRVDNGICYVPEGQKVFPGLTVYDNLELGALPKRARRSLRSNLEKVFEFFPILKERKMQLAGTLSGGERQMLAIGRALMSSPRLMMIDEPSLGLAPKIVKQIFLMIGEIHQSGIPILLVEQNVRQTLKMSNRTYILESGRITLSGLSGDLIDNDYVKKAYLGTFDS